MTSAAGGSTIPFTDALVNILSDPIGAVLVVSGAIFLGLSSAVFGYLALGALVDLVVPDISSGGPPPEAR